MHLSLFYAIKIYLLTYIATDDPQQAAKDDERGRSSCHLTLVGLINVIVN